MIELKKGIQKIKYCEEKLKFDSKTSEIVFTCWRAVNKDFKGEIIISFEYKKVN